MFTEVPFAIYKKHQHTLKECLLKAPLWLNTCLQRHESWMEPLENSVLSSTLNLEIIEKVKKKKNCYRKRTNQNSPSSKLRETDSRFPPSPLLLFLGHRDSGM